MTVACIDMWMYFVIISNTIATMSDNATTTAIAAPIHTAKPDDDDDDDNVSVVVKTTTDKKCHNTAQPSCNKTIKLSGELTDVNLV